ncbi:MAG TPA: cupin domain-containing protein [Bacteroidales bacterium]|nr:cupin domain-containing protein [Bacteroidales bacterium]
MEFTEGNIFSITDTGSKEEIFNTLFKGNNIKIEQINSSGQISPAEGWYDQKENEWVLLLEGRAKLEFENKRIILLKKGDYLLIPAHHRHKVIYTSSRPKCIWLAVFFK